MHILFNFLLDILSDFFLTNPNFASPSLFKKIKEKGKQKY